MAHDLEVIARKGDGESANPPLLFVHGSCHAAWCWDEHFLGFFAEHGYDAYALSLRGHGTSGGGERLRWTSIADYVADVEQVAAELPRPPVVIGHSLGGYLGLAHCITRPGVLRGLVLVATGPGFRDAASMQKWNDQVHLTAPRLDIPQVAVTASLHTDSMVIDRLVEATLPVGLIVGSRDKAFVGANDYMERKLADVRRRTITDGRHRLMRTHSGDVADMVREVAAAGLTPGR